MNELFKSILIQAWIEKSRFNLDRLDYSLSPFAAIFLTLSLSRSHFAISHCVCVFVREI